MDKVMKRLGIIIVEKNGTNVIPVVKCNVEGKLVGGGMSKWLSQLQGYAMKLNPIIDDTRKQPTKELNCIKEALETWFHMLTIHLSIFLFQFVPHVLIFSKFFKGSSKVGSFGYSKGFVIISHILSSMLEINVYSIIVFKVFGLTIPIDFHFAIVK
jgi:hypothetical protein